MPKPIKFNYEKKAPFRDASLFIIVCEGGNREPDYFRFFDGMSPRVIVVPVECVDGKSAPKYLIEPATAEEEKRDATRENDCLWFVIDTDKWQDQIHELRQICNDHPRWHVAQSNPCFEVWLYRHVSALPAKIAQPGRCSTWKPYLHQILNGGFDPTRHPVAIEIAIENAKNTYSETGYTPNVGSTQLWQLGEMLLPFIKKQLDDIKVHYPAPVVVSNS